MATTSKRNTLALASVGIDIGKNIFHLVGFDLDGKIVLRRKFMRLALVSEFKKLPPCIVGMEACLSAHLIHPEFVQRRSQLHRSTTIMLC